MNMRNYLEKLIAQKKEQISELRSKMKASESVEEVRSLGETLESMLSELQEAQEQLDGLDENESESENESGSDSDEPTGQEESARSNLVNGEFLHNGRVHSLGKYMSDSRSEKPFSSLEYRNAFKDYVQRGTPISAELVSRAAGDNGTTVTTDIGAVIPTTIMEELIKDVSKIYGQVYGKVRKLNIRGGVQFPIASLGATMKWIGESEVSDRTKVGDIKEYVTFGYHQAEVRISVSLLAMTVSLELFESEIAKVIAEAYVKAMDAAIISGTGTGQPLGITKDPRVTKVVEFTADELADWTQWRKKLFSQIPLSKRGQGEFLFTAATAESNLLTMKDANDRPLWREAAELNINDTSIDGTFFGRGVTLVEPDILSDADTASDGDVIGVYWVPSDYAVNTNLQFNVRRYFDEETNEYVTKGITIVDGKILDATGCYLLKLSTQ